MVDYSDDIAELQASVDEITTELGNNPQGVYPSVRTRLDILESRGDGYGLAYGFSATGDLDGNYLSQTVIGIQGRAVSATAPNDGYALLWDSGTSEWVPSAVATGSFSAGGDLTGSDTSQTVVAIRGNSVMSQVLGASTDGYVLTWDNADNRWEAKPATGTSGAGVLNVANLAALSAYSTAGLTTGAIAYVDTLKSYFILDLTSALTSDGITIVATSSTGRWLRTKQAHPYWITQTSWYIDPVSGNDEDTGASALLALATHGELQRRFGSKPVIKDAITVNIVSSLPDTDPAVIDIMFEGAGSLTYQGGTSTVARSGTLTGVTPRNRSANQAWELEDTGVANWSGEVGKRIKLTSGPNIGTISWVHKDLGASTCRSTEPVMPAPYVADYRTPAIGDDYDLESLPTIFITNINVDVSLNTASAGSYLIIKDLHLTQGGTGERGSLYISSKSFFIAEECYVEAYVYLAGEGQIGFSNCFFSEGLGVVGGWGYAESGAVMDHQGASTYGPSGSLHLDGDIIVSGEGSYVATGSNLDLGAVAYIDVVGENEYDDDGSGIWVSPGASVTQWYSTTLTRHVWGHSNLGYGIHALPNSKVSLYGTPTVTGALGDFNLGGSTTSRAWDETLGAYTTARANTWANWNASIGSGGFDGNAHNVKTSTSITTEEL